MPTACPHSSGLAAMPESAPESAWIAATGQTRIRWIVANALRIGFALLIGVFILFIAGIWVPLPAIGSLACRAAAGPDLSSASVGRADPNA